jgi:hypothetical protein
MCSIVDRIKPQPRAAETEQPRPRRAGKPANSGVRSLLQAAADLEQPAATMENAGHRFAALER